MLRVRLWPLLRGSEVVVPCGERDGGPVRRVGGHGWVAALAAILAGAGAVFGAAPDANRGMALIAELGEALKAAPAWQSAYHQEYVPAGMSAGETADGTVYVAWPDRALFITGRPAVRSMGLEGRRVRLVDQESGSCEDHALTDNEWQRVPLAAVLDPAAAVDRFTVSSRSERAFGLAPREPGGVALVEVELAPGGLPAAVLVVDPQGATNRFHFSGWSRAGGPPDRAWLPNPPAGVACRPVDDTDSDSR